MTLVDGVQLMSVLSPIVLVLTIYFVGRQAKQSADHAAVAVERVEETLVVSTNDTTQRLQEIHVLVNSRLSEALMKIDRLEAKIFEVTGEAPTGEPPRQSDAM
jgi:hypothetical protein